MSSAEKRNALGKGLSALLDHPLTANHKAGKASLYEAECLGTISNIKISAITVNPYQPRSEFDEHLLQELANSIKTQGLIQPVTVRKIQAQTYQLIAGERRLRASKLAGLTEIPAYIRVADDSQLLEMALIENIQREDLNPIEVALNFQRMIDECHLKQEELGARVSKNRSTVTNYLRLLKLPPIIQASVRDKLITMGHAKALIALEDISQQMSIYQQIIDQGLSVRQVEARVRAKRNTPEKRVLKHNSILSEQQQKIKEIGAKLDTKVQLRPKGDNRGFIEISFSSADDLSRILAMLG